MRWLHLLLFVSLSGCIVRGWVYRQVEPIPPEQTPSVEGLNGFSAQTCGACHQEIYAEWSHSMMAESFDDPLFQAKWQDKQENYVCLHCHAPLREQQPVLVTGLERVAPMVGQGEPNPEFDAALQHEGVTCAACHLREGEVVGTGGSSEPPHSRLVEPGFGADGKVCETCHQLDEPVFYRLDRPLIDTFGEWREWMEKTGRTESCVDCHMPVVERSLVVGGKPTVGHSHAFPGATDLEMLRSGLEVVSASKGERGLDVVLRNLAGHHFPTAEHAHRLLLEVSLVDQQGVQIAVREHEMARRIEVRVEVSDTTLRPAEVRRFESHFDADLLAQAQGVRVEVSYQRMGLDPVVTDRVELSEALRSVLVQGRDFEL